MISKARIFENLNLVMAFGVFLYACQRRLAIDKKLVLRNFDARAVEIEFFKTLFAVPMKVGTNVVFKFLNRKFKGVRWMP